jgi:hypothetical protein
MILISLICFFSFYNKPSADDFVFLFVTKKMSITESVIYYYNGWNGRYFSVFFSKLALNILKIQNLFIVLPIFIFLNLVISIIFLFKKLFESIDNNNIFISSFLFLLIFITMMPNIQEGIFWLSSITSYSTSLILLFWLFFILIRLYETKYKSYLYISILLCFTIIGSNETVMLFLDFFLFLLYLNVKDIKFKKYIFILIFIAFISTLLVYFAPGNLIRSSMLNKGHNFIYSILKSLQYLLYYLITWSIITPFIFLFIKNYQIKLNKIFFNTILNVQTFYLIIFSLFICFFASFWSTGNAPPGRVLNIIFIIFLLYNFILCTLIKTTISLNNNKIVTIIIIIFSLNIITKDNCKNFILDIKNDSLNKFSIHFNKREVELKNKINKQIVVKPYIIIPISIYFDDITNETDNWKNRAVANYYNLESISLEN